MFKHSLVCALVVLSFTLSAPAAEPYFQEQFLNLDSGRWDVNLSAPLSGVETRLGDVVDKKPTGSMRLRNLAYVFTRDSFSGGGKFKAVWTWENHGSKAYSDNFLMLLRTTGKVRKERPYDTLDGLRVMVDPSYGVVHLDHVVGGKGNPIAEAFIQGDGEKLEVVDEKPSSQPAVASGQNSKNWYTIEVIDDGRRVSVRINGVKVFKNVKYDASALTGARVGLGNREYGGGFHKISYVASFSAAPLK